MILETIFWLESLPGLVQRREDCGADHFLICSRGRGQLFESSAMV